MEKYKSSLVKKIKEEEVFDKKQEKLKEQYGFAKNKKVIIVERNHFLKFGIKTVVGAIRIALTIALLAFATIGLLALLYPETRAVLQELAVQLIQELNGYLK